MPIMLRGRGWRRGSGEDEDVDGAGGAVGDDGGGCDALDACAVGVEQVDVGTIECLEVGVAEGGAFALGGILGCKLCCCLIVLYDLRDALAS